MRYYVLPGAERCGAVQAFSNGRSLLCPEHEKCVTLTVKSGNIVRPLTLRIHNVPYLPVYSTRPNIIRS